MELGHLLTHPGLICLAVPLMVCTTCVTILMSPWLPHKIKTPGLSPFFVYSSSFSLSLAIFSVDAILRLYDPLYLQGTWFYCGLCNGLLPWICANISDLWLLPVPRSSITGSRIEKQSTVHGWQEKWNPSSWFTAGRGHFLLAEGECCAVVCVYVCSYIVLRAFWM